MNYKMLKQSNENMCSAGIDEDTGYYYLCILSGFANVPAYYPIVTAEYNNFEKMDYETITYISNRCIQEIGVNKYKLQWASAYNPLYAIAQRAKDVYWQYEIPNIQKSILELYKWDELILTAYTEIAEIQNTKR